MSAPRFSDSLRAERKLRDGEYAIRNLTRVVSNLRTRRVGLIYCVSRARFRNVNLTLSVCRSAEPSPTWRPFADEFFRRRNLSYLYLKTTDPFLSPRVPPNRPLSLAFARKFSRRHFAHYATTVSRSYLTTSVLIASATS